MRAQRKRPEVWISGAALLALGALFVLWWRATPGVTAPGRIAALLSAALFAAVGLRFVPRWMDFWRDAPERQPPASDAPPHFSLKLFFSLLAVDMAVILLVYLLRVALGYRESFVDALQFWTCTDSQHYLDIARDWYLSDGPWDRLVQLVFLPGYPLAVRTMALVVGDYLYAGLLVSALAFALSGCVFYRLLRLDRPHADALRTVKYLCILPGAFFFAAPMSESLFLLLCLACVYCARRRRWYLAGLLGGLAAFTRSLGVVLLVPVLWELVADRRAGGARRFFALLLIPLGFAAYCGVNYAVARDPFQFMTYQSVHWGQHLGLFFNTAAYQLEHMFSADVHTALGLWLPNVLVSFAALVLMLFAAPRMRPSDLAFFLAYYVVAIGATWLLSAPRYLVALYPVPMALSAVTRTKRADGIATACCGSFYLLYACAFVLRWQVW